MHPPWREALPTPQESRLFAARLAWWAKALVLGVALLALVLWRFSPNRPVEYADALDHFYYGSIGADISGGLPARVLRVLPAAFPEHLPRSDSPRDLTAFGFIQEDGAALPIGFSLRRSMVDLTSLNCATCHTGTVREAADAEAMVIPGMPAVTLDLYAFFRFLFDVARDPDFTTETVRGALAAAGLEHTFDYWIIPTVVERMRDGLRDRAGRNAFFFEDSYTPFGPGRVNTFDTFKTDQFREFYRARGITPMPREMYGIVDFPSVWNQKPRDGLALHWDGNQTSVRERNFSAAIGAGARPEDMDVDSLLRVEAWLAVLPPPAWPFAEPDAERVLRGKAIYGRLCAECHDFGGARIARVMDVDEIGTDPHRAWSYTRTILEAQQDYTAGFFWAFENFSVTEGYSSHPLDGIWARAPYLHNGSVPSLLDLLTPDAARPRAFEAGVDVYDTERLGFAGARLERDGRDWVREDGTRYDGAHAVFDVARRGNAATGHSGPAYGTTLPSGEKRDLLEYLKTL